MGALSRLAAGLCVLAGAANACAQMERLLGDRASLNRRTGVDPRTFEESLKAAAKFERLTGEEQRRAIPLLRASLLEADTWDDLQPVWLEGTDGDPRSVAAPLTVLDEASMAMLARPWNSWANPELYVECVEAFRTLAAARASVGLVDAEKLEASAAKLEFAGAGLLRQFTSPGAEAAQPDQVEVGVRLGLLMLKAGMDAEAHADYDGARLWPAATLEEYTRLSRRTVGIMSNDGVNPPRIIGSGVLVRKDGSLFVVTAAHVLAYEPLFDGEVKPGADLDPGRVMARLGGTKGDFGDGALDLRVDGVVGLVGKRDYAILRVSAKGAKAQQEVERALEVEIEESLTLDHCVGAAGLVFGFSAIRDGRPELTWIPPGRIVFPVRATPPIGDAGDLQSADRLFLRALMQQVFARGLAGTTSADMKQESERLLAAYRVEATPWGSVRMLHAPVGHAVLSRYVGAAEPEPMIPCFGTDLTTEHGCSGGPIYMMTTPPRLVGIVSGKQGKSESREPLVRSLDNFSRAVPWALIQKDIR